MKAIFALYHPGTDSMLAAINNARPEDISDWALTPMNRVDSIYNEPPLMWTTTDASMARSVATMESDGISPPNEGPVNHPRNPYYQDGLVVINLLALRHVENRGGFMALEFIPITE